jgi:hypothetical protein
MILRQVSYYSHHERTWKELLFWILFWGTVSVLGYEPHYLSNFAHLVGIRTGSNALFLFSILVLLYGFGRLTIIVDELESKMTKMVREDALRQIGMGR